MQGQGLPRFSAPLFVEAMFVNKATGEIKEQEVFMGDFPMMTERGTFIINGTERVVVSQLVRSPGRLLQPSRDKTTDKDVYIAKIIPSRGAWLEFDVDKKDTVGVRIDRKRRQNVTVLLKALGWTADEILALFDQARSRSRTPSRRTTSRRPRRPSRTSTASSRPGERPDGRVRHARSWRTCSSTPSATTCARVGRYKVDKKLEAAQGVLQSAAQGALQAAAELDNPDKKGWDQPKFRVLGGAPEGRAGRERAEVQGDPVLRGHAPARSATS